MKEKFDGSLSSKPGTGHSKSRQQSDTNTCCNRRLVFVGGLIALVIIVLLGVIVYLVGKNRHKERMKSKCSHLPSGVSTQIWNHLV